MIFYQLFLTSSYLLIMAMKANLRVCQGFAKQPRIIRSIVGIMTGGTLDILVKKREYRVEIRRIGIMTSNTRSRSYQFILMTPVDTDGVVIRQVDTEISVTGHIIGTTVAAKTVQCYSPPF